MLHKPACIFDMDGLLFDTERLCMKIWQELGEIHHFTITDELYYACIGHNFTDVRNIVISALGSSFPYDQFRKEARERMNAVYEKLGPPEKPGIRPLFDFLKKNNIPVALATSTVEQVARSMIAQAGLTEYFSAWAFGSEIQKGKPEPDIFLLAAERLAQTAGADYGSIDCREAAQGCECVDRYDFIVFEDSEAGLEAAYRAGMKSVFIKDLILPRKDVMETVWAECTDLADAIRLF